MDENDCTGMGIDNEDVCQCLLFEADDEGSTSCACGHSVEEHRDERAECEWTA